MQVLGILFENPTPASVDADDDDGNIVCAIRQVQNGLGDRTKLLGAFDLDDIVLGLGLFEVCEALIHFGEHDLERAFEVLDVFAAVLGDFVLAVTVSIRAVLVKVAETPLCNPVRGEQQSWVHIFDIENPCWHSGRKMIDAVDGRNACAFQQIIGVHTVERDGTLGEHVYIGLREVILKVGFEFGQCCFGIIQGILFPFGWLTTR